MSAQIIVFKCVVNMSDQDFGAFCLERSLKGKKRFGEQPGATKPLADIELGELLDVEMVSGVVDWASWAVLAMVEMCGWLVELQSLLGWLWWHWIFMLVTRRLVWGHGRRRRRWVPYITTAAPTHREMRERRQ